MAAGNRQDETYNVQKAIEAIGNQDYDTAAEALQKEIDENPKNGYAYLYLSMVFSSIDNYGSMITYSSNAIKYLPKKEKEDLGVAYYQRFTAYLGLEEYDKALADISKAIELDPDPDYLNDRQNLYYNMFLYDEAEADALKITQLQPGSPTGYLGLGRIAFSRGDYQKAIEQYNYAIKLNDEVSQCYSLRTMPEIKLKRWGEAADDVIAAWSIDPTDDWAADSFRVLADSAANVLCTKLKIKAKKDPTNSDWYALAGVVYDKQNKTAEAISYYKKSYDIEQTISMACKLSDAYSNVGRHDDAIYWAERAADMDTTNQRGIYQKLQTLTAACRWADAEKTANFYLDENPEDMDGYIMRCSIREHLGNLMGAEEDLDMALALDSDGFADNQAGLFYMRRGNKVKATEHFTKVIEAVDSIEGFSATDMTALCYLGRQAEAYEYIDNNIADTGMWQLYNFACTYALFGESQKAVDCLNKAIDKGFRQVETVECDYDLDAIRSLDGYKKAVERMKELRKSEAAGVGETDTAEYVDKTVEVPMTKENGVYKVKCSINDLPLHFVFDTGAADVTMSSVEASFMLKNNYIGKKDIVGSSSYLTAAGDIIEGTVLTLRKVDFGGLEMNNVKASVVKSQNAPLLLGQSVLSRLGKVEIDYDKKLIRITQKVKK